MDGLSALLDGPRARGAFLLRCLLDPPWSIRLEDEAPLTVTAVVRGHAWVQADGAAPVRLGAGDVVVRRGPQSWRLTDEPTSPDGFVIHPDQRCTTVGGVSVAESMSQGVRSWGNSSTGETVLLAGVHLVDGEVGRRLLDELPPLLVVRADEHHSPLVQVLATEVVRDAPGQSAVLDRLLDLVLISVLRTWFDTPGSAAPRWYTGQADPVVGPAVRLVQHHPEHPWTVAALARETGLSRAAFARRFTAAVGQPPVAFLTQWRLALAADLLLEPGTTLAAVARQVGYSTPFALSTAFTRERGLSPRAFRERAR